jgi:hypothetical protein
VIRLLKRCAITALKAPFAAAADLATLGKFGEGSYLGDLAREHERRAEKDEALDDLEEIARILR